MVERICRFVWRHSWQIGIIAGLVVLAGACKELPVDQNTANVTRRPKDTLVTHDTTIDRDTTIKADTVITTDRDTLIKRDTVVHIKTVIRTVTVVQVDSVIERDTLRLRDTIVRNDTLKLWDTLKVRDTLKLRDTLTIRDTVKVVDTVTVRDTISKVDTLREVLKPRYAMLFRKTDTRTIDSVAMEIDDITLLVLELSPGTGPTAVQLKLIGRVVASYDTVKWGAIAPSWLYMIIPHTAIVNGSARREFAVDPWNNTSAPGLAIIPRAPYNRTWVAAIPSASSGTFTVAEIDTTDRWLYCYVKAKFGSPSGAAIDSLALRFQY
ncbi:MAG: hypothetical protein JST22_10965 [Bacteroidetes bacterium]|nr:hypothetical protein [Bacteroidota bacterium]